MIFGKNASPARVEQKPSTPNTRELFSRSAVVLGRPVRTEVTSLLAGCGFVQAWPRFCSVFEEAAEDGLAPTEERSCVQFKGFCSTGAAEDGRAPTEEPSCVRGWGFCSTGNRRIQDAFVAVRL